MANSWIFRLAAVMTLVCIAAGCSGARRTTVTSVPAGAAVVVPAAVGSDMGRAL